MSDTGPKDSSHPSSVTVPFPSYLPLTAVNTTGDKAGLKWGSGNLKEYQWQQKLPSTPPGKQGMEV